jgi:hypothetical protein
MDPFTYEGTTLISPYTNGKHILQQNSMINLILYGITSKGLTKLYIINGTPYDANSGDEILGMLLVPRPGGGEGS